MNGDCVYARGFTLASQASTAVALLLSRPSAAGDLETIVSQVYGASLGEKLAVMKINSPRPKYVDGPLFALHDRRVLLTLAQLYCRDEVFTTDRRLADAHEEDGIVDICKQCVVVSRFVILTCMRVCRTVGTTRQNQKDNYRRIQNKCES